MFRATLFTLLALFATTVVAQIKFDKHDDNKVVVASFGDLPSSVSVLYRGPEVDAEDVIVSDSSIFTLGAISSANAENGFVNYTIAIAFDKDVGKENYTVTIGEESISGNLTAAGFVIKSGDKIVSGEGGDGITVGQGGTTTYKVRAVDVDGTTVDISDTRLSFREITGPYMKEVDVEKTSITSSKFTLSINQYRVGRGEFIIMFESESIEYFGEVFETILRVTQSTTPEPPCVAIAGDYESTDGFVRIDMFNLLNPPKAANVSKVTLTVGSEVTDWVLDRSTLAYPDQIAAFKVSGTGKGSLTCDDEAAVIVGGEIDVTGDGSAGLATDLIESLPESDTQPVVEAIIRVMDTSVATFSKDEGERFREDFCALLVEENPACVLSDLKDGSVIITMKALVDEDNAETDNKAIDDAFAPPNCPFQTAQGRGCEDMELQDNRVVTSAVGGTAVGGGLATWVIVVIAVVGAMAVVVVVVLALWAVYRKSSENSESEYSSSGPLGVPDPSDLLYEQSIVRDIYGRGDFPDGGPSQAVAEQRAREAQLREEFPRPPSSSGLSRGGAPTDEASSTYSV